MRDVWRTRRRGGHRSALNTVHTAPARSLPKPMDQKYYCECAVAVESTNGCTGDSVCPTKNVNHLSAWWIKQARKIVDRVIIRAHQTCKKGAEQKKKKKKDELKAHPATNGCRPSLTAKRQDISEWPHARWLSIFYKKNRGPIEMKPVDRWRATVRRLISQMQFYGRTGALHIIFR